MEATGFHQQVAYPRNGVLLFLVLLFTLSAATIKKPEFDPRLYSSYVLSNGISVVSIQHLETPKSGYAAAVRRRFFAEIILIRLLACRWGLEAFTIQLKLKDLLIFWSTCFF